MTADLVVQLIVAAADAELVADRLWANGASAIEERPAASRGRVLLVAGFPTSQAARTVGAMLGADVVAVDAEGWRDRWKEFAHPVVVGSVTIAPAWQTVPVGRDGLVVEIDPGPCFGSGGHPTTRLLLAALDRRARRGQVVLDVGTGSGVLAVVAARLGARRVLAVDIDPEAVAVARRNAGRNGVGDRVIACCQELGGVGTAFDLVVANLTAGSLATLAPDLVHAVRPGGQLLLSGLLTGQWPHIAGHFCDLDVLEQPSLEGWDGVVLQRPSAD